MGKFGECDFSGFFEFQEKLQRISQEDMQDFYEVCAKDLAARLLWAVIKRTPVGDYSHEVTVIAKRDGKKHKKGEKYTRHVNTSGKTGGTLRRGWTAKSHEEAAEGKGSNQKNVLEYVNGVEVRHVGNTYEIQITNPVEYASYVEYGHRTRGGKGWVTGRFMLTISENEIRSIAPQILERRMMAMLKEVFK